MSAYQELLRRRKDRACAIILSIKEREIDPHVDPQTAERMRKVVLDQINEFHDLVRDVVSALEDGSVTFNTIYLEKMEEKLDGLYAAVVNGHSGG